jgi:hypothetical protein
MTNPDLTLIAALLDRSYSMSTIKESTEAGYNTFIKAQCELPGELLVTLAQFDHAYEVVYPPTLVMTVPPFTLQPRGNTALCDALGRFIIETGEYLAALPEEARPGKIIVVVMTDGEENASREWTDEQVKALVKRQQEEWNWEFVFLGANIDAVTTGARFGFNAGSSITYTANAAGTASVMDSMNEYVVNTRSGLHTTFSDADRTRALGIDPNA